MYCFWNCFHRHRFMERVFSQKTAWLVRCGSAANGGTVSREDAKPPYPSFFKNEVRITRGPLMYTLFQVPGCVG